MIVYRESAIPTKYSIYSTVCAVQYSKHGTVGAYNIIIKQIKLQFR